MFFHDLLYLIEEEMIVILSKTKTRISSSHMLQRLTDMHRRGEEEGFEYLQRPCRQPRPSDLCLPVDAVLTRVTMSKDQVDRLRVHTGLSQRPEDVH